MKADELIAGIKAAIQTNEAIAMANNKYKDAKFENIGVMAVIVRLIREYEQSKKQLKQK